MNISSTAVIKDKIQVDHTLLYAIRETVTVNVDPAPIISSISVSELPKSKVGQTFVITGGNFAGTTNVTSTAGTVTSYVINSALQITVTITTGSGTGYKNVTVTTATGTITATNVIRMYTEVIPGTTVAWGNITGTGIETGAGYIRRNVSTYTTNTGGNFLVTSSTTVDVSVEMVYDSTNHALYSSGNQEAFLGFNNNATNAQANRFSDMIGYIQIIPGTSTTQTIYYRQNKRYFISQWDGGGVKATDPNIFTTAKTLYFKRTSQVDTIYMNTSPLISFKGLSNTALYMDFCISVMGFKNIIAKVYD